MIELCKITDIPKAKANNNLMLTHNSSEDGNAFETTLDIDGKILPIFIIQHEDNIRGYVNSCPHTGVKLNWLPGKFLDAERRYIQCTVHDALFEKESGRCIHGPCLNDSLQRLELRIQTDKVYLVR